MRLLSMNQVRRWQRIKNLSLLSVSVIALIVFVSSRLKTFSPVENIRLEAIEQVPIACGLSAYEAFNLYKGRREIVSNGTDWRVSQLVLYCAIGMMVGVVGGLLGLEEGAILYPLFLEPRILSQYREYIVPISVKIETKPIDLC